MKIVIAGCGKIGKTIIASLVKEKHEVIALDSDPAVVQQVVNTFDVIGICGNATDMTKLVEAGVGKAELFIAATGSDELNMLGCFAAKRLGAQHTAARIRDEENNDEGLEFMKTQLDLSFSLNPEQLAARAIYDIIKLPSATKVETFSSKRIEMIEIVLKPDSPLEGKTLAQIRKAAKSRFLICVVARNSKVYIPKGNFELKSGDRVGLIASESDTHKVLSFLGETPKPIKNVMVLGAGITSYYLAQLLLASHIDVKLIEKQKERCVEVCQTLKGGTVIRGDGMSQDLLLEEGIQNTDAFVALSGKDEENILISFYAMSQKVPKVISKVNRDELSSIAEGLGLDCIITPRKIVADVVVRYARALQKSIGSQVETLYSLFGGEAEALEFKVLPSFAYSSIPLKDLKFKDNIIIAGIIRGNNAIIPSGDDTIEPGDNIIVIAAGTNVYDLSDIIAAR